MRRYFNNTFFIGLLSFFGGISQDIFVPILPLYLANVLHLDKSFIGLTEGIVTSSASIFKIVSGFLTDKLKSRKSIVFVGYFLSFIARPLLAFTSAAPLVLGLRFIDGVAKAFIADLVPSEHRGKAYGIYNSSIGLVTLPASIIAGFLWDKINPSAPFLFGAIIATFASILLFLFTRLNKIKYTF